MAGERQPLQLLDELLFPKIFQAFHMAVQPGKLGIALLGVAIICLAGHVMDFSRTVVVRSDEQDKVSELQMYIDSPTSDAAVLEFRREFAEEGMRGGVFATLWRFGAGRFHAALRDLFQLNFVGVAENIADCFRAVEWAVKYHYIYCLAFVAIKLAVLSVAGGAICRIAALQFSRGEKPGLVEALRFSLRRFTTFFFAPLAPVIGILCIAVLISLVGVLCNIPRAGQLITSIVTLLALAEGALIAVALIGTVAGFNLMYPAVAYDGLDALDVIGRSFSYVFNRPWRMAFYSALAAVYGAGCYLFVRLFAFLLILVTHVILRFSVWSENNNGVNKLTAIWPEPKFMNLFGSNGSAAASTAESVAAFVVYLFLWVIVGLVVSVIITFYFSANTVIYSLMRNKVDNAALDEVYLDSDDFGISSTATVSGSE
jgi:hypothetical protein